jgi:hypothetical protein
MLGHQASIYCFGHCLDLSHHSGKGFRCERLFAIRDGMCRVLVDFDDDTIRACGNARSGNGGDEVRIAGRVGGIDHNRKMGQFLKDREGVNIRRIASRRFKGADPALAQDHARIAATQNIFACHEHLLDGSRHAALEKDRRAGFPNGPQQVEVLHVARPPRW